MLHLTTVALILNIIGIFTSVSILGLGQILMFVPACFFLMKAFQDKRWQLPKSSWFLLAFIFITALSLALNYSELLKPGKNFGRLRYFLSGVLFIFVFRYYLENIGKKAKELLLGFICLCLVVVGLTCLYQVFVLHQDRAKTLTDTLRYGYGMGMVLPVLIGLFLQRPDFINRKVLLVGITFGLVGLYLTFTRGAMLGFICALPFVIYFWDRKKGLVTFAICGTAVAFLGGFYLFGSGELGNRLISSKNNGSDSIRYTQWEAAYKGWTEKPILGMGLSEFINKEQEIKKKYGIAHDWYQGHAHNTFLEVLVGSGLLGLVAFLGWMLTWGWEILKSHQLIKGLFIPFLISLIIGGQFEVVLDASNVAMIFLIYALSSVLREKLL